MNFVSWEFLVFFFVVGSIYFLVGHRSQNVFLLLASYFFYGWWDWRFLGLIFISSIVDFFCGLAVDRERRPDRSDATRKRILAISVCVNLGILGFFKYYDFFVESLIDLALAAGLTIDLTTLKIILPVGISFYTFQTMSYTIDVYRGKMRSTDRLLDFMLYVSFFPQLVAGPIERGSHLLPQILSPRKITSEKVYSGAQLVLVGFFKKMVIADNMATIVNSVFNSSSAYPSQVCLAIYAFALQIYCDFSGYTDIARGIARIIGFDICLNFNLPYFATNPSDFWRRWHISLSSWLKDYLYIPLGGNRFGLNKTLRNMMITMLLGGLWHGASWNFVLWGAYHGVLLIVFRVFLDEKRGRHPVSEVREGVAFWACAVLYFHLTCFGWLIFRVGSVEQLFRIVKAIVGMRSLAGLELPSVVVFVAAALPLTIFQIYQYKKNDLEPWVRWPSWLRVVCYLALFYGIVLFGAPERNDFIYFQF